MQSKEEKQIKKNCQICKVICEQKNQNRKNSKDFNIEEINGKPINLME